MASSLNHVSISGRLTANPTSAGNGKATKFSVACNRSIRDDATNAWREEVSFFNCVAFSGLGTRVMDKLVKGDKVVIFGRLQQSRYEQDGVKKSSVSILVNQIEAEGLFRPTMAPVAEPVQEELPVEEAA